jgi:phosphoenolpyruvate carboxykinase (ATP)
MQVLQSHPELEALGFSNLNNIYWQLHTPQLYEHAVRREEGYVAHLGPLVVSTGPHTGRSPKDRFIVREPTSEDDIWWGEINHPFESASFDRLLEKALAYFQGRDVFVRDCYAGAENNYRLPVRVITETAWHNLFANNMFIRPTPAQLRDFDAEYTVIYAADFKATPEVDGTNSDSFVIIHLGRKIVLIGGTAYAGEMKKAVFSILNWIMPRQGLLSMHCSANEGEYGDVALFFGLSGTGKTTLSADSTRTLIGDDEHGWSENGVFNFEGGCYAKTIRLSPKGEPEIYETTRRFGTILENVGIDLNSRRLDLDDDSLTENTRASYPISHIPSATMKGVGGHPHNIIFLTADAFGVLPPVARLTLEQAMFHFISGYTAKVAGTERGVTEPQATFSACFGAPFLPLHPTIYANLLRHKLNQHRAQVWLVNTGWTGGPYGVGRRIELHYTRSIVHAILDGQLDGAETLRDPVFGLHGPTHVPHVPDGVLTPRDTWQDRSAYDAKAADLARRFMTNFEKYANLAGEHVLAGGPKI